MRSLRAGSANEVETCSWITRILRRAALPLGLAVVAAGLLGSPVDGHSPRPVKVMTRNLYLGANLDPAMRASTTPELLAATAHIFSVVHHTDFPERAKSLAREIADADPVLVGIQEAAIWYTGLLGDPAPATTVVYDFIAILRQQLAAIGAPYDVVRVQPEADLEAPAGAPYFRDVRLLQNDAILVKAGLGDEVVLGVPHSDHFAAKLVLTTGLGQRIEVDRGWVSVDAVVNRRSFRFVNTHLEAFHPTVRLQQAQELIAPAGPVGSAPGAVILVGDLNSGPDLPVPANRLAFAALVTFGLIDTWAVVHPGEPGYTAGFNELLNDPSAEGALEHRVDHVLATEGVGIVKSRIYGADPDNRTASGLWPSDHAGVAATLAP
ncbi:MAG: endonuclease [Actinomycetota bacterium]|nr:endonuclease [Actinomycetota bacterium]